jgi:PAS domain S-box-containing protein
VAETEERLRQREAALQTALDTLERERRVLRAIVDDLPIGVMVVDGDGAAVLLNRALSDMWRGERPLHDVDAYRQYEAWDLADGAPVGPHDWPVSRALATGERQPVRSLAFRRFDGTTGVMESAAAPILDAAGRAVLGLGVAHDVTERREASARVERRERELASITDNAPAIIARFDRTLRHLFVNRAIEPLTGLPASDFIDRTNRELGFPDALCDGWEAVTRTVFESGEPQRFEFSYASPDGEHHFQGQQLPERDAAGRVETVLCVVHDVTELRRVAAALREADRRKDEFLAMLAHELRNPLAPIVNALRVLERTETLGPGGRQITAMIGRQLSQLRRLVDDLLEVSRISRGLIGLRPEAMTLERAVRHAADAVDDLRAQKGQALEVDVPGGLALAADPMRVTQILENLLSNASKYTPAGGRIGVGAREDGSFVELRVHDDGVGLEADQLESVFEMFVRAAPGVGEHQGGLGIGLALARRLATLHGGTLHAESEGRGRGACFVLRLPTAGPVAS